MRQRWRHALLASAAALLLGLPGVAYPVSLPQLLQLPLEALLRLAISDPAAMAGQRSAASAPAAAHSDRSSR